jgi:hypothetical protein
MADATMKPNLAEKRRRLLVLLDDALTLSDEIGEREVNFYVAREVNFVQERVK